MGRNIEIFLRDFIKTYVSESFKFAEQELPVDEFYKLLFDSVSKKSGISEKNVLSLHHPFHWIFFCNGDNSGLEYVQNTKRDEKSCVRLTNVFHEEYVNDLSTKIWRDYGELLKERIRKLDLLIV